MNQEQSKNDTTAGGPGEPIINKPETFTQKLFNGLDDIGKLIGEIDVAEIEKRHGKNVNFFTGMTGTSGW